MKQSLLESPKAVIRSLQGLFIFFILCVVGDIFVNIFKRLLSIIFPKICWHLNQWNRVHFHLLLQNVSLPLYDVHRATRRKGGILSPSWAQAVSTNPDTSLGGNALDRQRPWGTSVHPHTLYVKKLGLSISRSHQFLQVCWNSW